MQPVKALLQEVSQGGRGNHAQTLVAGEGGAVHVHTCVEEGGLFRGALDTIETSTTPPFLSPSPPLLAHAHVSARNLVRLIT